MSVTDFSKVVNLPVSTIWRYVNGKFKPSADNALKIEEATKGVITIKDLLYPADAKEGRGIESQT